MWWRRKVMKSGVIFFLGVWAHFPEGVTYHSPDRMTRGSTALGGWMGRVAPHRGITFAGGAAGAIDTVDSVLPCSRVAACMLWCRIPRVSLIPCSNLGYDVFGSLRNYMDTYSWFAASHIMGVSPTISLNFVLRYCALLNPHCSATTS